MKEISAGGVVYRRVNGAVQIQLIEDRYGKISLPKGKMEPGETAEETALREIAEETGIAGKITDVLETVQYTYTHPEKGEVDKAVYYFLVEAVGGELKAQTEEIRRVEWCDPGTAVRLQRKQGYPNNEIVLKRALDKLGVGPAAGKDAQ